MAHIVEDEKTNIYKLLAEAKRRVGAVGKNEKNQAQHFNFRGIDAVINAIAPVFNELGIIVAPEVQQTTYDTVEIGAKRTPMSHVLIEVKYTFYGPEGDSVVTAVAAEAMDSGDKAVAKAMSVAMRIALLQTLNLPTDEPDPDSQSYERTSTVTSSSSTAPSGVKTTVVPVAPDELIEHINNAATVEELRVVWKQAGGKGLLQATAPGGISVQELLYKKNDELGKDPIS